jgi:hypothetical protein
MFHTKALRCKLGKLRGKHRKLLMLFAFRQIQYLETVQKAGEGQPLGLVASKLGRAVKASHQAASEGCCSFHSAPNRKLV